MKKDDIAQIQKDALSAAYRAFEEHVPMHSIAAQYQGSIRQSIVDLHALGYPIISFYLDDVLTKIIPKTQFTSMEGNIFALFVLIINLPISCVQYHDLSKANNSLCGALHMHNLNILSSSTTVRSHSYIIHVPHFFYISVHFFEIVLFGGLTKRACYRYQSFQLWHVTKYPFSTDTKANMHLLHLFCGIHTPFSTIVPSNHIILVGVLRIRNTYSSCKMKYTATDIKVGMLL